MKVYLLYKSRDFDATQKLPWNEKALTRDLQLNTLFGAMALQDEFVFTVSQKAVFSGLSTDMETVLYRQDILKDCLKNPALIKKLYALSIEAIECRKKTWFGFSNHPSSVLSGSVQLLRLLFEKLKELRSIADAQAGAFRSTGFIRFFTMLQNELGDDYFSALQKHLNALELPDGILFSAQLGRENRGEKYLLRKLAIKKRCWIYRFFPQKETGFNFSVSSRDESGCRMLANLEDEGIKSVANAVVQATEHILGFFSVMRTELAFYAGCLNLHEQLAQKGKNLCIPQPAPANERRHLCKDLYDVFLLLNTQQAVTGNELNADNKNLVIITGANQGGKTTFLRSIGAAQLMMQAGMFVAAESFSANLCYSLFTHFKREEDITMKSGKLDEELNRMSAIADHVTSNSLVLFNESFAATNEREGSEIARQIVSALVEKNIKVFFVTHLYDFAHSVFIKKTENSIFIRAERENDGRRTFKLREGEPLQTSYGEDLYNRIFETS